MGWFQEIGQQINNKGVFIGCPLSDFEKTSKDLFILALKYGLDTRSNVLEVGTGCFRTGFWFIKFLDKGKYCGIEPNVDMVQAGWTIFSRNGEELWANLLFHDDLDFGKFDKKFDFVVSFSTWSHAAKHQIKKMMIQFVQNTNPEAKFITSFIPAYSHSQDYKGDEWVGKSHKSNTPGVVNHSVGWIRKMADSLELNVEFVQGVKTIGQSWLVLTKK